MSNTYYLLVGVFAPLYDSFLEFKEIGRLLFDEEASSYL